MVTYSVIPAPGSLATATLATTTSAVAATPASVAPASSTSSGDLTSQSSVETCATVKFTKTQSATASNYIDEEYIPTHTNDSPVASVLYVPSKRDQIAHSNQEYTPTKSTRNDEYSSPDSPKDYCPGGSKLYQHEQYNPSEPFHGTRSPSYDDEYKITFSPPSSDTEFTDIIVGRTRSEEKLDSNSKNVAGSTYSPQLYSSAAAAFCDTILSTPSPQDKRKSKKKIDETPENDMDIGVLVVSSQDSVVLETPPRDNVKSKKRKDGSSVDLFGDSDSDTATKSKPTTVTPTRAHLMRKSKNHSAEKSIETITTSSTSKTKQSEKASSSSIGSSTSKSQEHNKHNWLSKQTFKFNEEAKIKGDKEKNNKKTKRSRTQGGENVAKKRRRPTKAMTEDELKQFTENHTKRMEDIDRQREIMDFSSSPVTKIEVM